MEKKANSSAIMQYLNFSIFLSLAASCELLSVRKLPNVSGSISLVFGLQSLQIWLKAGQRYLELSYFGIFLSNAALARFSFLIWCDWHF